MENVEARNEVIEAGRRLVESGLTARTWGNISCRISPDKMIITPSGRDYRDLRPEELVEVNISDISYSGNIKPSVEKSFHAAIYKLHPEVNFIIHTHQVNASAASVVGKKLIMIHGNYPLLGKVVVNAKYGVPGSKKLCRGVVEAVKLSVGHAVLLRAHGAVCYGRNLNEAFDASKQLERACEDYIIDQYRKTARRKTCNEVKMISYALARAVERAEKKISDKNKLMYNSRRTDEGILFSKNDGKTLLVPYDKDKNSMSQEIRLHFDIYKRYQSINSIVFTNTPYIKGTATYGIDLRPLLDDFAQIAGPVVRTVDYSTEDIIRELKKSSAVFIKGEGALCVGSDEEDSEAVAMILDKTCRCLVSASLFDSIKYLNRFECFIMRKVYLNKYSKKKKENSN